MIDNQEGLLRFELSKVMTENLWLKGLITDEEKEKILVRMASEFGVIYNQEEKTSVKNKPVDIIKECVVETEPQHKHIKDSNGSKTVKPKTAPKESFELRDLKDELVQLKSMLQEGLLKEDEYEIFRNQIIDKYSNR